MTNIIIFFSQEEILKPWKHGQMPFSLGPGQQLVCLLYFLHKWACPCFLPGATVILQNPYSGPIASQIMLWELPKEHSWGRTSSVWWTVLKRFHSPLSSSQKFIVLYMSKNSPTYKCPLSENHHICCALFHITLKPLILTLAAQHLEKPRISSVS